MTIHQIAASGLALLTLVYAGVFPDSPASYLSVVSSHALLGFSFWLERKKIEDVERLEAQVKDLRDKVNSELMARGLKR